MKKILYIISLLILLSAASCVSLYEFDSTVESTLPEIEQDDNTDGNTPTPDEGEDEDDTDGGGTEDDSTDGVTPVTFSALADYSATMYPTDTDTWIISDSSAELDAFYGLRDALWIAYDQGRQISLTAPNLTYVPNGTSYKGAFSECHALKSVAMPMATSIGDYSFYECTSLNAIYMPLVASVGVSALAQCSSLSSIDLPAVTSLDLYAFSNCSSLTALSLATNEGVQLSSIGMGSSLSAFENISTEYITLTLGADNSAYVVGTVLIVGSIIKSFREIILVDGDGLVVDPNAWALSQFSATSYPDFDTWVISDQSATTTDFAGLSAALMAIDGSGRQIALELPNMTAIPSCAIYGENYVTWVTSDVLVSVKASAATSIGSNAFAGCKSLVEVDIPKVTTLGNYAFEYCYALESVNMPNIEKIGYQVFYACWALSSLDLGSVNEIGIAAFSYCTSLPSVTIPSSVTSIGGGAFSACTALTSFTCQSSSYTYEGGVLYTSDKSSIISALKTAVSGDFANSTATSVEYGAFAECDNITSISLPEVTTLANWAFRDCSSVTTITLPSLTTIGNYAFGLCTNLTQIECATNDGVKLTTIQDDAFLYTTPANITLYLGYENSSLVSGNTLTLGTFSATFGEIISYSKPEDSTIPDMGYEELL